MIWKILILFILILVNGIFSATEIAFLSVNKFELSKYVKKGNKNALKIVNLLNDSSSFLSAIQVVITLSGFLASAFAAESFAGEIAAKLNVTFISIESMTTILIVIITVILSYFTLVFGELVPKKIGLVYANGIAFKMVLVIDIILKIFKPFIFILKISTDFIVKLLKIEKKQGSDEEELKNTILDSSLEDLEKQLLLNVFSFNDTNIKDVMTNKCDVICLSVDSSKEQMMNKIKQNKFTRFPIVENNKIIGLLNVKDLIINYEEKFDIRNYMRKIDVLPSDMIIDDAFLYLNSKYESLALVCENGEYIGIVTIEDIVEELVGNVFDEYDIIKR